MTERVNILQMYKNILRQELRLYIPALSVFFITAGFGAESGDGLGFKNPVITQGADGSLVERIESAVIIPWNAHEELWVHPEVMTIPGNPVVVELRARTTDRLGKDRHTTWHYFRTMDLFGTLQPVTNFTAAAWKRKDITIADLATERAEPGSIPASLGHTWC